MKLGYVDTSCLIAIAFEEPGSAAVARRLRGFDELIASNLLEAEFRAACAREGVNGADRMLDAISWVIPDRSLGEEITTILSKGYVRGADLWHLATALYVASEPSSISFVTLDDRQRVVAKAIGFKVGNRES
jgi:hypothetical protein